MDSSHGKKRKNVKGDRISNLPDDLIYKILSFINIKHAIKTSSLSSRWRYIWTTMPYLNLSTNDFSRLPKFSKFVTRLLSKRNNQTDVFSVSLTFRGKVSQEFVSLILNYAFSHNVQQLNITGLRGHVYPLAEFPPSLFISQSLKHLTLTGRIDNHATLTIPTWTMPNLTTLNLHDVTFYDNKCTDLFSNCPNLKNLALKKCTSLNSFIICHTGLSNLTLEDGQDCVKVITPQLTNLIIKNWRAIHLVSASNLSSLRYKDHYCSYKDTDVDPLQLPTNLPRLETVDLCIDSFLDNKSYTRKLVCMLQQLRSVKFLTLNLELVKFFSLVDIISHQPSPFVNLKSLKVYPVYVSSEAEQTVTMSAEVKNYLLDGSPFTTFTMVSHEEVRVVKNVTSAKNLMSELQYKLIDYFAKNTIDINQNKGIHMATLREKVHFLSRAGFMLSDIDALLENVPLYYWYKFQARFSSLTSEVYRVLNHVNDLLNQYRNELATLSQPSS